MTFEAPPEARIYKDEPQLTLTDLTTEMSAFGLKFKGQPVSDGEIHRVPGPASKTKNDTAGWYAIAVLDNGLTFADYGDWRSGVKCKWSSRETKTFTAQEKVAMEQHQTKITAERARVRAEASQKAGKIWKDAFPAADHHPYLTHKQIRPYDTKIAEDGRLIVPVYINGQISSLQYIDNDGRKLFHPGGKISGGSYLIPGSSDSAIVCEGFATAATIAEATGFNAYCAFNAGNLEKIIAQVKGNHTKLIIAGDEDKWTDGNPGRKAAEAAARKHQCQIVLPTFSDESSKPSDFNDLAQIDGPDAVKAAIMGAQQLEQLDQRYERLRPLTLEQLACLPPRTMLVKGVLGVGEMSVWFGEPKCGKSFLVTHLGLHIATGKPWFGKKVKQGAVVYVVAEGAGGFAKRIEAHRQHYKNIDDALFFPIPTSVNLLQEGADLESLIHWIKHHGAWLVVLDTLSRTMPGGNENGPEDMGAYIANCDKIREQTGAHVLIVHHKPKGNNNTPRGHSSLFGAADVLILVEKKENGNLATVEASKDEKDGDKFGFSLEVLKVGVDEDDEDITSCAVVVSNDVSVKNEKRLTGDKLKAMDALYDVLLRSGEVIHNHYGIPPGVNCVNFKLWRQEFYARKDGAPDTKQKAFKRASDGLYDLSKAAYRDGYVWVVRDDE